MRTVFKTLATICPVVLALSLLMIWADGATLRGWALGYMAMLGVLSLVGLIGIEER